MAPFGVKVMTVMTGMVGTNISTNSPEVELPPNSRYHGAAKQINDLRTGESVGSSMPASVYAKRVVDDVLRGTTGLTWRGKMASMGRTITSILPTWLVVSTLYSQKTGHEMGNTDKLQGPQFGFWEGIGTCGVIYVL